MNYQKYESYETFLLYQEFLSIPDNPFSFQIPEGMMMTTAMIHTFLRAAYNAKRCVYFGFLIYGSGIGFHATTSCLFVYHSSPCCLLVHHSFS